MCAALRIFIGLVLLISGIEKVISPYQNFLYVIQAYQFLPGVLEKAAAIIVPWVELIVGLFMVLGLWLNWSLKASLLLFLSFVIIVGQALLRALPIDKCGCFGEAIHIPPMYILVFDSLVILVLAWLLMRPAKTLRLSLDTRFK